MIDIDTFAGLVDPLFRYGIPHEARREVIPIPTESHFIAFEVDTVGPLFTMHRITAETEEVSVPRDDDYVPEFTLPERLRTQARHYRDWNRAHPELLMDIGHQTNSRCRRHGELEQHDVDSLPGCCPESPAMNRTVKGPLEAEIVRRAGIVDAKQRRKWLDVRCAQGPFWSSPQPSGRLASGQWIPDGVWISTLWRSRTRIEAHSWKMFNTQDRRDVLLDKVSLDAIEELTTRSPYGGLQLWSGVRGTELDRGNVSRGF